MAMENHTEPDHSVRAQLGWFVMIWLLSVIALGVVAYGIRILLR